MKVKRIIGINLFFLLVMNLSVYAGLIGDVGNSFKNMFANANFLYFLFFMLSFVIFYTVFAGASKFIPAFKDNSRLAKAFGISMSLLITTLLFTKYKGNVMSALGPFGWKALLFILIIVFVLWLLMKLGGGQGGKGGGGIWNVLKWILIIIIIIFVISLFRKGSGGSGVRLFSGGGGTSDWLFWLMSIVLIGIIIYMIFRGIRSGGSGLGGGAGGKTDSDKSTGKKSAKEKKIEKAEAKAAKRSPGRGRVTGMMKFDEK